MKKSKPQEIKKTSSLTTNSSSSATKNSPRASFLSRSLSAFLSPVFSRVPPSPTKEALTTDSLARKRASCVEEEIQSVSLETTKINYPTIDLLEKLDTTKKTTTGTRPLTNSPTTPENNSPRKFSNH